MPSFTFVAPGFGETVLVLEETWPQVATLAARLRSEMEPGAPVGLMFRSEPILVLAWLACLHAGLRPLVMQYPTAKQSHAYWTASVANTVGMAQLGAILCDEHCRSLGLGDVVPVIILPDAAGLPVAPAAGTLATLLPDKFAIIQLSSGTTGFRKAVEFRSADLRRHVADFNQVLGLVPGQDRIASWLPLYHDMGYVACFVMPLLLGIDVVMMDPMVWVREPILLFQAIEKHGCSIAYMPNFGFEVMSRCEPRPLPSMRYWISCSEPVSALTARRFISRIGAPPQTFAACYAMAENIFAVSLSAGLTTRSIDGRDVVSCGRPIPGVDMKLVEDELWVRSPTSLRAYLGGDDIRDAEGYYPTGDLGALLDGEVYVTGRKQDLIIQAGRKFMLSDIDLVVNEAFPAVKGRVATVQVDDERLGTQKPLVLIEAEDFFRRTDREQVAETVRGATGLDQVDVAFVPPRFLTKTSSGKINRKKSAQDWAAHLVQKAGADIQAVSVEREFKHYFAHMPWDRPVGEIMDSLSLTVLRIVLNDAGLKHDPVASLNDLVAREAGAAAPTPGEQHIYIVNLSDRTTVRQLSPRHIEELGRRLGAPVTVEHICLPPSPVLLSDLIFQDYFLPRLPREDFAVVERQLNKLRRASMILVDDVAEMGYPPAQVYGVLSHNLERDPRASLVAVRWQRYPQQHHKLPVTVVAGCDLPLKHRSRNLEDLSAYLGVPVYRIATLRGMSAHTAGWEFQIQPSRAIKAEPKVIPEPATLVKRIADWVAGLPAVLRRQPGKSRPRMEASDLAHFCSRFANQAAIDVVLESFDRFCVVGHECSVPYVAEKLAELGKPYQRTMSYQPEALAGVIDEVDCVVICGAQGRYASDKPVVALMGADRTVQNWTPPARPGAKGALVFVEPVSQAPASRTDWYYPFALERGGDMEMFKDMRTRLRVSRLAKQTKELA